MIYACDNSALSFLSVKFIKGDPKNALIGLNRVVISKRIANKIFGNDNPIGKKLKLHKKLPFNMKSYGLKHMVGRLI